MKPPWKVNFEPVSKTDQDNFIIQINGVDVGTLWWKRNHPRPEDKVAVTRDLIGNVFISKNESLAAQWCLDSYLASNKEVAADATPQTGGLYYGYNDPATSEKDSGNLKPAG